jgi:hypothetical protein
LIRTFPEILGGAILKAFERRNAEQIERLKNELSRSSTKELEHLRADYETLRASTEYLAANQSELRAKMISSAELLWNDMLVLRNEFGSLINFETIFLPSEISDAFERGKHPQIMKWVEDYREETRVNMKLVKAGGSETEKCRLFVGDKLWMTYYAFRAIILRIAYMTNMSFQKNKYRNWREDEPSLNLLAAVLGRPVLDQALKSELPALTNVLASLEGQFLAEAMRIMSGSKVYADSIADVRSTMTFETARVRAEAELRDIKH